MTRRMHITVATLSAIVATLWIATGSVFTQEPSSSPPQAETSTESWNVPRTADGQPDIQGMWVPGDLGRPLETPPPRPATRSAAPRGDGPPVINIWHDVTRTRDETAIIVDPSDGTIPWQAWAVKAKQYISGHQGKGMDPLDPLFLDPVSKCLPYGVPRINSPNAYSGYQFLQRPGMVVIHYEQGHQYRIIRLDERPHVGENIRLWNGNSRGHWEGNTLVVDVTNFNGKTWVFGRSSSQVSAPFTSPGLTVVERFIFTDPDTIQYEVTMTDPDLYSQPWTISTKAFVRAPEGHRLYEYACYEGNRATELITSGNQGDTGTQK